MNDYQQKLAALLLQQQPLGMTLPIGPQPKPINTPTTVGGVRG